MTGIDARLVVLIVPLVLLELGLTIWALWELTRPGRRVRGESRLMWARSSSSSRDSGRSSTSCGRPPGRDERARATTGLADGRTRGTDPADTRLAGAGLADGRTADVGRAARGLGRLRHGLARDRSGLAGRARDRLSWPLETLSGRILALDGLDLDVPTGSVFGLLGPNGAGKTTTLRILVGLAHPTGGSATVAGVALGDPRLTDRIGFLNQDPRYYGWSTGRELVELVGPTPRARRAGAGDTRRRGPRPGRAGRCRRPPDRDVLRRDAPAPRDRPGARRPAAGPDPRRAGQLARPGRSTGPARPDRRAADHGHRPVLDPRPRRRRAGMRPDRDPRPRSTRRRGPGWPGSSTATRCRSTGSIPSRIRPRRSTGSSPRSGRPPGSPTSASTTARSGSP